MTVVGANLESLSAEACLRLLASHPIHVGRVTVVRDGAPHVYPVTFRMDGDAVVFRTATGSGLHAAAGQPVAFEVDSLDPAWQEGWSVVLQGRAREIVDPDELERARRLPLHPWAPGPKDRFVRIDPWSITGRRIR